MAMVKLDYKYIAQTPGIRSGKPVIAGTRIGVHDVMGLILNGSPIEDIVQDYPGITKAQVYECLAYVDHDVPSVLTAFFEKRDMTFSA